MKGRRLGLQLSISAGRGCNIRDRLGQIMQAFFCKYLLAEMSLLLLLLPPLVSQLHKHQHCQLCLARALAVGDFNS